MGRLTDELAKLAGIDFSKLQKENRILKRVFGFLL
jgi:hypothetical protein